MNISRIVAALCALLSAPPAGAQPVTQLWANRYNGPANGDDHATATVVDRAGNVIVTGHSTGNNDDYYTAKYAGGDGALLWEKRYNGPANGHDHAHGVAVDSAGNVIVTGWSSAGLGSDYYTAKYAAADGALLWEHRYNGPGDSTDIPQGLAVDSAGNVAVTGYSELSRKRYYTAKYAAADGALLWERTHSGTLAAGPDAAATGVVVDSAGNVIVTGVSFSDTGADYYTVKYAAGDGALLWERRYTGPGNSPGDSPDVSNGIAVDSAGNVAVTGWTGTWTSPGHTYDIYTAKYAAADGALLWERRYNGPANKNDRGHAVVMDSAGNVAITGYSFSGTPGSSWDYYTAKYAAADGALLWEKRYSGPGNAADSAYSIAVDRAGNICVVGQSGGAGTDSDCYTAKYAAADGTLLWEQRYNGPANGSERILGTYGNHYFALTADGGAVAVCSSHNGVNYDYAIVRYGIALNLESVSPFATGGAFRINYVHPGARYLLESSTDLGSWDTLSEMTFDVEGPGTLHDPRTESAARRFYRVRVELGP